MCESSTPQNLEDLTVGYVLGNLCPDEAEEFKQILAENPQLHQDIIAQWQEVLGLLPYAQVQAPPTHLRDAILAAIEAPLDIAPVSKPLVLPWAKITAGTAAIIALALGLDGYNLRQQYSQSSQVISILQGTKTHIYSLKSKEPKSMAVGSVFMDFEANKAVIALQDVPPPSITANMILFSLSMSVLQNADPSTVRALHGLFFQYHPSIMQRLASLFEKSSFI